MRFSQHESSSEALPTTAIDTVCRSSHAEALQVTASEMTRAGFEPTTLRSKGIDSTNAPPRPARLIVSVCLSIISVLMYTMYLCTFVCTFVCVCVCLCVCVCVFQRDGHNSFKCKQIDMYSRFD